jgi:hypothetical protein
MKIVDQLFCPNCKVAVEVNATSCKSCKAVFSKEGWQPIAALPVDKHSNSTAGTITKLGIASVLIPAACFIVGFLVSQLIPGCHCDEGAGCNGCGANGLIGFLLLGGFAGALGALIFVLPASLLLAAIVRTFSGRHS